MKVHQMKLHPIPFELIKKDMKIVEVRLNDEKRQSMEIGDRIEFSLSPELEQKFQAEITGRDIFNSFRDAYAAYPPEQYGGKDKDEWKSMYQYYSREEEMKFGVLGIRLKRLT